MILLKSLKDISVCSLTEFFHYFFKPNSTIMVPIRRPPYDDHFYHSGVYHINNVTNTYNCLSVSADVLLFEISQTKRWRIFLGWANVRNVVTCQRAERRQSIKTLPADQHAAAAVAAAEADAAAAGQPVNHMVPRVTLEEAQDGFLCLLSDVAGRDNNGHQHATVKQKTEN